MPMPRPRSEIYLSGWERHQVMCLIISALMMRKSVSQTVVRGRGAFGIVTADTWKQVKKGLQREFRIDVPGTGIVFTIPLSSIGGKRELGFLVTEQQFEKGDESELKETKHELIVAIANYGYNTQVMHAAEEGGATGGTVLHGKGVGMKRAKQFLGVSLVSEKEIILIVARTQQKNAIMKAIMEKAGVDTKAGAIVFSMPVTDTAGLRITEDED